jgi:hypothetical protein
MASAVYTATPSQWASAAIHLENRSAWRTVRIDGVRYVVLVSGNSGRVYYVRADARGCGCAWSQRAATPCSHRLALELAALEDDLVETAARTAATLTPEAVPSLKSLRDVWPGCAAGCGNVTEGPALCDECAAEQTTRLELAEKAAATLAGTRYAAVYGEEGW